MSFLTTIIGRLRFVAILEAISYLILLGYAMPMKYFAGKPEYVSKAGMIHGILFVLFCLTLLHALLAEKINFKWSVYIFIASLIPLVPFFLDKKIAHLNPQK